jgi:Phage Mu protein F like protein
MQGIEYQLYRKAFVQYLRKGTPIERTMQELLTKAEHPTTHYIWRTQGDDKVRSSHTANEGKIFAWDNPPETGYPGEDFGCRCWAEPYKPEVNEYLMQTVTSIVDEGLYRWWWYDFVLHYYFGGGEAIQLSHVGNLQAVIDVSREHVFKGVERQVIRDARAIVSGSLSDTFENTYPYYSVSFIHGRSTVRGRYEGFVTRVGDALYIDVDVAYYFRDVFTDPLDIRERDGGTSDPRAIQANELIESEVGGQFYDVSGDWTTRLSGVIHIDPSKSGYGG